MEFSIDSLEYGRLKELLGRYISTAAAKQVLAGLTPITDEQRLEDEHVITAEAMAYLRERRVPFNDIALLPQSLEKLAVAGSALDIEEVEAIQSFLQQTEGLRIRWKEDRERFRKLADTAQKIPDLRELSQHLARAVHNGEIDDRYSPELARIRRALQTGRSRLTGKLESFVRNPAHASQLQDDIITIRNGRFVIPVRSEQKRSFEGIVHGSSSSGATVFMEPLAVLEMNNELVRLEEEERNEVRRILAELTDRIQQCAFDIEKGRSIAAHLELTFAKARFGRDFNCTRPLPAHGIPLSLIKARHPLLEDNLRAANAVMTPVSLIMDSNRRILVISGPNAGGKTVVLKTVGLLSLMAQSGIPVPAEEAVLPVFDRILADIGDQQSITNHLSTFSAHVLTIKSMLESASSRSLILFDEIGGSTEPGEGAALARAVLEQFRHIGALTIATTHYNRLKLYAEATAGVANSAMEFNEVTLEPTYRLIHGLAGASSGLKIAERLQLPPQLLQSAARFLDSADVEAAYYAEELRRRIADLESEKSRLERERREFEAWKDREVEQLTDRYKTELDRAEAKLERIVLEMADRAARELESERDDSIKRYQRKLANAKAQAASEIRREREKLEPAEKSQGVELPRAVTSERPANQFKEGTMVRVLSMGVNGLVASIRGDSAEVLVGSIKLRRPLADLDPVQKMPVKLPEGVRLNVASKQLDTNEIYVVGCRVDEAIDRTDKFLDDAVLAQMSQVRIVHGTGTGALRHAISEFLGSHPHVARFAAAPHAEGGRGVTVVTLRE